MLITELRRELTRLDRAVERASARRRDLAAGSSRARVTTANARWSTACEARDRIARQLAERETANRPEETAK